MSSGQFSRILCLLVVVILISYSTGASVQSKISKHGVLLIVSFDGFRLDYLTKAHLPAFQSVQDEGVSVPYMIPQFPTKTFPNHQSIATSLYPDVHGVIDNKLFDPTLGKELSGYKPDSEMYNYKPEILPLWIQNQLAGDGRHSGCYMWAGSSVGYGANGTLFPTHYIPKYNGSVPWEERVEEVLRWMTDKNKPANLIFLYHNEPDSTGHNNGTETSAIIEEIKKVDKRLSHLSQRLKDFGVYDDVNLVVLSDHGMATVEPERVINTTDFLDPSLYQRYGGSPLYHIRPLEADNADRVYQSFKAASERRNFTVYRKSELSEQLKYGSNPRIMDILLLADPGFGFEDLWWTNKKNNETGFTRGVHGYDNRVSSMWTIFMARGPAFKKGYKLDGPIENVDLGLMFAEILHIPDPPSNGTKTMVSKLLASSCSVTKSIYSVVLLSSLITLKYFGIDLS